MTKQYTIDIFNGTAIKRITNGVYNATAISSGYDSSTLDPKSVTVNSRTNTLNFKIAANGTLTLLVTDTGKICGNPIEGAVFYRCDSHGNTYGDPIITNKEGKAVFKNVPFNINNAPTIYYKQTESDNEHNFDATLKHTTLIESSKLINIENPIAERKTINLTDANYEGLKIESAQITLSEQP